MGRMEPLASAAFGRGGRGLFMLRMRHAVEEIFFASERGSGGEGGSPLGASAEAKVFVIREKRERHFPALCKEAVFCTNFYL